MDDNQNLLSCFWKLADSDEAKRAQSVIDIIKELKESSTQDETLAYALKRLVKGLGSSRKKARQGFSAALVHVLNEFSEKIELETILELMNDNLKHNKSVSGNEERDAYFGKVFGFLAILQHLLRSDSHPEKVSCLQKMYVELLNLMKKKKYLREVCAVAICKSLSKVDASIFKEHLEDLFFENLPFGWESGSAEEILLTHEILLQFKDKALSKRFKSIWECKDVLASSNLEKLTNILMSTTEISHPKTHSLWKHVLAKAVESDEYLNKFWKVVVEGGLLQSTHERKFVALQILLQLSSSITSDMVETLFSEAMMKCLINSCNSKENFLFKAAREMLSNLPLKLASNKDENIIPTVIKVLVGRNGNIAFDIMTNTKTIESLTLQLLYVEEYFQWLREIFVNPSSDQVNGKDQTTIQVWALNQMTVLSRAAKKLDKEDLILNIGCFLFLHSYFQVVKRSKKEPLLCDAYSEGWELTEKVHELAKQRFQTVLTDLTCWRRKQGTQGQEKVKLTVGVASDGVLFTEKMLQFAEKLITKSKFVTLCEVWVPETYDAFNEEMAELQEEKNDDVIEGSKGIQLLRHHATLHLFKNQEEAIVVLKDVQECCRKVGKKSKNKKEPHWCDVLLEILVGFLAQPSLVMRHVVENVFRIVSSHVTNQGLKSLIEIISTKKSEDLNKDDEDESENEEEKDEAAEGDEGSDKKNEDEESESSDDSESDEDDENEEEIDEAFKKNIKEALNSANVSINEDENEEEDDLDMDSGDTEMLNVLDRTLAGIFKQREDKLKAKKEKKANQQAMHHFKLRVLDLITIFMKEQPKDERIINFIKPLLDLIYSTQSRPELTTLHEKSVNVFRSKLCQQKNHHFSIDNDEVIQIMKSCLTLAKRSGATASFVDHVSLGMIFLVKVVRGGIDLKEPSPLKTRSQRKRKAEKENETTSVKMGSGIEGKVIDLYIDALEHFMSKRTSTLQPKLFMDLINRFPSLGWKMGLVLPQYLNTACNNFRKMKCCEMMKSIFSHKVVEDDTFFKEIADRFIENLVQLIDTAGSDSFNLKPRQLCDIIRLTDGLKKLHTDHPTVEVKWSKLQPSFEKLSNQTMVTRSTALSQLLKSRLKICNAVTVS